MKHKWSKEDDIVALYLYKFGEKNLTHSIEDICKKLGIILASMNMRIENFRYIDTNGDMGLENYAKLSRKVYEEYKNYLQSDLALLVKSILSKK